MAAINVTSVHVLNNPSYFLQPLQFEIQYECLYNLQHGAVPDVNKVASGKQKERLPSDRDVESKIARSALRRILPLDLIAA